MPTLNLNDARPAANFPWLCRSLAIGGAVGPAERYAREVGAPERVSWCLKPGVPPASMGDPNYAGDLAGEFNHVIIDPFTETLSNDSVFFALFNDRTLQRVPLHCRLGVVTQGLTGSVIGEGKPVPLSRLTVDNSDLEPVKCAAMLAGSETFFTNVSTAGQALFNAQLRSAISAVVDEKFLDMIFDSVSAEPTHGTPLDDLALLLANVTLKRGARPVLIMGSDVAVQATTARASGSGEFLFPNMSPVGGEMANIRALVTDAASMTGKMALINGAQIVAGVDPLQVSTSRHATIEMVTNPEQDSTTSGGSDNLVSLWQENMRALMVIAPIAAQRVRDDAVVMVENVAWVSA
jgi:hypothetical protein